MGLLDWFRGERRASPENPAVSVSDGEAWQAFFGGGAIASGSGIVVSAEAALGIAAYWCGVNFLADTFASLPRHLYRRKADGNSEMLVNERLYRLLHDAVSEDITAFDFWRAMMVSFYTRGAAFAYVERDSRGLPVSFWQMETGRTRREVASGGRRRYHFDTNGRGLTYAGADVIDLPWMMAQNGVDHVDPIAKFRETLGSAIAVERQAGRHFANGGLLPYILTGPFTSAGAASRAKSDVNEALTAQARAKDAPILALPLGHDLKTVGSSPAQSQMVELQRFMIGQVARHFNLPPSALQDYADSKYTTAEQQDLVIVKHTVRARCRQIEDQLNLRVARKPGWYVEHNLDGLLRGDFKTRMEGLVMAVRNGIMTPNEARSLLNYNKLDAGEKLLAEGQLMPLDRALAPPAESPPPPPAAD